MLYWQFLAQIFRYISRVNLGTWRHKSRTHTVYLPELRSLCLSRMSEETPSVAKEFSELCDALRDKYEMPEGDWKALLDKGMALHARIPEGALSFEAVQVVGHESALNAVDVLRRDLDPILSRVEEGLRNGVAKEEDAGSKKPEREMGADEGAAWAAELMRNLVQYRIDLMLKDIGEHGNVRPATQHLAEAAIVRLAEREAALRESPRPYPAVQARLLGRRVVAAVAEHLQAEAAPESAE